MHDVVKIANVMSMIIHFINTLVFRTNFPHDIEIYNNPTLRIHTLSKQRHYIAILRCPGAKIRLKNDSV